MKRFYIILALLICLLFTNNVYAEITIEILDQNTPTGIHNGEYTRLLRLQITTEQGDLCQIRCGNFFIDNTFSWLNDLRFEDLQWKEGTEWIGSSKVSSEWEITVPCWNICLPNEIQIIDLYGAVISSDVTNENEEFQINLESADWLWISGNPVIVNNFPQHKNIIIIGNTSVNNNDVDDVTKFRNFPNPFNPTTMISFYLSSAENVKLEIFNAKGQKIKTLVNEIFYPGQHQISWDGTDSSGKSISSGVYYYRMEAGEYIRTKKMVLTK